MQSLFVLFQKIMRHSDAMVRNFTYLSVLQELKPKKKMAKVYSDPNFNLQDFPPPVNVDAEYYRFCRQPGVHLTMEEATNLVAKLVELGGPRRPKLPQDIWNVRHMCCQHLQAMYSLCLW